MRHSDTANYAQRDQFARAVLRRLYVTPEPEQLETARPYLQSQTLRLRESSACDNCDLLGDTDLAIVWGTVTGHGTSSAALRRAFWIQWLGKRTNTGGDGLLKSHYGVECPHAWLLEIPGKDGSLEPILHK